MENEVFYAESTAKCYIQKIIRMRMYFDHMTKTKIILFHSFNDPPSRAKMKLKYSQICVTKSGRTVPEQIERQADGQRDK